MILAAISTAGAAWVMGEIVDAMTNAENRSRVYSVAGFVLAIFVIRGFASFAQVVFMSRAGNRIVADKQNEVYGRLMRQGVGYFSQQESSDLLMRLTNSARLSRAVVDTMVQGFVKDLLTLIGLFAVMFYQQPVLTLICLVFGPLVFVGLRAILRRVRGVMGQELAGLAEIMRVVQETSQGVRVIKAFGLEDRMSNRMNRAVRTVENRSNKIARLQAATTPLMDTLTGVAIAAIVILSGITFLGQEPSTAGQLMSFVTALLMAYEPAKRLSRMRVEIERGLVGVRMMYDLIDQPDSMTEAADAGPLPSGPGEVRLENVSFGYKDDQPLIENLSFTFEAGKTTAFVGPSGSGKTTIMNLVMRLYDPISGRVLIDGHDVSEVTIASLRNRIGFVGQDTFLFSDSVLENLRMGRPDASDEEVVAAAKVAHAHEFISDLEQGYDTLVGENGAFLSGGQRQRLAIARAVLRGGSILLLDEATSALDSHSEVLVRDALEQATRNVTTIVIAHRLSTILNADCVCYVEDGAIVEHGSVQSLLEMPNGRFKSLYETQFRGAKADEAAV